jgi:large subunit ribosomal protein L30
MKNTTPLLRLRLCKSVIGRNAKQKACVIGLGLKLKLGSVREVLPTPENLGMINKISFLLEIHEIC